MLSQGTNNVHSLQIGHEWETRGATQSQSRAMNHWSYRSYLQKPEWINGGCTTEKLATVQVMELSKLHLWMHLSSKAASLNASSLQQEAQAIMESPPRKCALPFNHGEGPEVSCSLWYIPLRFLISWVSQSSPLPLGRNVSVCKK